MKNDFSSQPKYLILEELKRQTHYVSGEDLASKLNITRQALWKHITTLQQKGYQIVAVPHLGYKLISCPDKLYPWEIQYNLNTKFIGRNIYHYEVTKSTQDIGWQLGLENQPQGTLVVSERQTKGRGRLRRNWISPKGGLYFSLLLKPAFITPNRISQITLLSGLSCIHAIKEKTEIECSLKWPNDILLNHKKVGGILCELNAESDRVNFVVVGIGINTNTSQKLLPPEASSLCIEKNSNINKVKLLKAILENIEKFYISLKNKGFPSIRQKWEESSFLWGKRVKVKTLSEEIEGQAEGIDEMGCLILRRNMAHIEKIFAGDVVKVE